MEEQLARLREFGFDLDAIPVGKDKTSYIINLTGDADRPMVVANVNGEKMPFYFSSGAGGKSHVPPNRWYPAAGIGSKDGWINKGVQKADDLFYGNKQLERIGMALDEVFGNANADEFVEALPMVNNKGSNITKDFINSGQKFTDLTPDRKPTDPDAYKVAMNRLRTFASDKPLPTPPAPPVPVAKTPYTPQFIQQGQVATTETAVSPPTATAVRVMAQRPQVVNARTPASLLSGLSNVKLPPAIAPALGAAGGLLNIGMIAHGATRENMYDREYGTTDIFGTRPAWDFMGKITGMYEDSNSHRGNSVQQAWREMKAQVADPEYQMRSPHTAPIYGLLTGNTQPAKAFIGGYVPEFVAEKFRKNNADSNFSMMESNNKSTASVPQGGYIPMYQGFAQGLRDTYEPISQGFAQGLKDTYLPMWQKFSNGSSGNNMSMMEMRR